MHSTLAKALGAALLAVASAPAFAIGNLPSTGNGRAVLTLLDEVNGRTVVVGLSRSDGTAVNLEDLLPSAIANGAALSLSFDVTGAVADFVAEGGSLGSTQWHLSAADAQFPVGAQSDLFGRRLVVTSSPVGGAPQGMTNNALRQVTNASQAFLTTVGTAGNGEAAGEADTFYALVAGWGQTLNNVISNATAAFGQSLGFYYFASGTSFPAGVPTFQYGGRTVDVRQVFSNGDGLEGQWRLFQDGSTFQLQYSIQPIPLPAAGWMLLSGLVGLAAVARRRRAAAA